MTSAGKQHGPTGSRENRLAAESSPYLLQHRHNPVDWWSWGEGAFDEARRRDVPIFLSIGYSTCYWCHVMERESFEDEATARLLKEHFVSVKVDREERPEVDDAYMAAVQAFSGRGGWPMSVFLEPVTLKPFHAGTYYPPDDRFSGMPSFSALLLGISAAWRDRRAEVVAQAEELSAAVREQLGANVSPAPVGADTVTAAVTALLRAHDAINGGFGAGGSGGGGGGGGPKFPQPCYLDLLMEFRAHAADDDSLTAVDSVVRRTLDAMALGGLNDHVGGGFHRYCVDARWTVPHFEKMLYDNAQLALLYARASREYTDSFYARTARRTLDYVLREMTTSEGLFCSAQDAEVDGREGQNYLWTPAQVREVLDGQDAGWACRVYGLDKGPNFRDPHHPDAEAANVLRLGARPSVLAAGDSVTEELFLSRLDRVNAAMYGARAARPQPRLDDKSITAWTALMISAFAGCGMLLEEPSYVAVAARAADAVLHRLWGRKEEGGPATPLRRTRRDGVSRHAAALEDYALLISALLELGRTGESTRFVDAAGRLLTEAEDLFADRDSPGPGGYFDTTAARPDLFVRPRSLYDGAVPSGNSVMLNALLDFHEITGDRGALERATGCLASMSGALAASPVGGANAVRALLRLLTIDSSVVERTAAAAAGAPAAGLVQAMIDDPVEVHASTDQIVVGTADPGGAVLEVRIADPYHIVAPDNGPGSPGNLEALRVWIANGTGIRVYADYPPSEPAEFDPGLRIYRGVVRIPVILEREGAWAGTPLLALTYQPCRHDACLRVRTVELDITIDRA